MAEEDEDDDDDKDDVDKAAEQSKSCPSVSDTLEDEHSETDINPMDVDLDSRPPTSATSTPDDEACPSSATIAQL